MMTRLALSCSLVLLASCADDKTVVFIDGDPLDAGSPPADSGMAPVDEGTPDTGLPDDAGLPDMSRPALTSVDLLFVIDNSGSMQEEQESIVAELPLLIQTLASGEIRDPDTGALLRTFTPVERLRVGVVSSDMGTGGTAVPTCTNARFGDDGLLNSRGNTARMPCLASYRAPQTFDRMGATPAPGAVEEFAMDVACVAELGVDGCGFEQQLEGMLKAVTPASSSLTFQEGTPGNGTVNGDFGGDDTVLAIVMLTDEDDCSTAEPALFNPSSTRFTGDLNLRCFNFPEAVRPVSRFRDGLLAGRDPGRVVFMPIVGVPVALAAGSGAATDYDAILAAPEMQEVVDPVATNRLLASCNVPGRGLAFPPRRIVELARDLDGRGAHAPVASICQSDYGPAIRTFVDAVTDALAAR